MRFELMIDTNNAAFTGAVNAEVARILRDLASRIEDDSAETNHFAVVDGNGNRVGTGKFV